MEREGRGKGKESRADSALSAEPGLEPHTGLDLMMVRPWLEQKPRVGRSSLN